MAQVSRRRVTPEVDEKIIELFLVTFTKFQTDTQVSSFLNDFLTRTEKIMLSKRLATSFMLLKRYDSRTIQNTLKVSGPTVWTVKKIVERKNNALKKYLISFVRRDRKNESLNNINHVLERIIPLRPGTDWKKARARQWKKRRQVSEPF